MPDGPAWGPPAGSVSVSLPEALPPTRAAADTADRPLRLDPPVEDRLEGDADSGDASPPSPSSCSTPPPFKPSVSTCVPPLGSLLEMLAISSLFFPFSAPLAPPSAVGGRSGSAGSIFVAGARKRALPLAAWPPANQKGRPAASSKQQLFFGWLGGSACYSAGLAFAQSPPGAPPRASLGVCPVCVSRRESGRGFVWQPFYCWRFRIFAVVLVSSRRPYACSR